MRLAHSRSALGGNPLEGNLFNPSETPQFFGETFSPAQDGERAIRVWISIEGLSELSRVSFGINTAAINKALQTHRNYIERRAGEELNVGADEVELGVGALFPVR